MKFVDVKNDVAFRKIFGSENKTVIIISFLNAILNLEGQDRITSVALVNPFQLPRIRGEKASIIDVRAKDVRGRSFIVEMQIAEKDGFAKRVQFYSSKEYASQIDRGDDYTILNPVYFIGILSFKFFSNKNYFTKHLTVDEQTGECTFDDIKFRFIELPKFKKKEHELVTIIDKWTYFIKRADRLEVVPSNTDDEGLLAAYEEAKKHNWTKEEYDEYIYAGMRDQDQKGEINAAVKKGVEKGIEQKNTEVIKKCLKKGMSVEDIADITDLSVEEVKKIINGKT
jgi:predicted transposase/invertase (TIGR01784 family)